MVARSAAQASSRTSARPPATRPIGRMPSGGSGGGSSSTTRLVPVPASDSHAQSSSIASRPSSRRVTTDVQRPVAVDPSRRTCA